MVASVLNSVIKTLFSLLQYVIYSVLAVIIPIFVMCGVFFIVNLIKGKKIPRRQKKPQLNYAKGANYIKMLFWDFPKRLISDYFERNPDGFDTYGVHLFCGEQGSGKSMAAVHFAKCILERNSMSQLASNIDLNFQQSRIESWEQILTTCNGEYGQIIFLDEMQNWFSSNESKNFPPEMLTEITQQRKQRKIVIGTSQVFGRVSKPIREQITLLYKPMTIAGALTIVRVYKVDLADDGTVTKMHFRRWYAFVHDDELRNCYDTYEKVQRISVKGFQPRSEQPTAERTATTTNIIMQK